ncbi:MAG: hypothetical protein NTW25_14335 [Candidatus Kapabacteria bacterium]|nr:hypothetical protein [Candidatus Kapabacteria bacterium]
MIRSNLKKTKIIIAICFKLNSCSNEKVNLNNEQNSQTKHITNNDTTIVYDLDSLGLEGAVAKVKVGSKN